MPSAESSAGGQLSWLDELAAKKLRRASHSKLGTSDDEGFASELSLMLAQLPVSGESPPGPASPDKTIRRAAAAVSETPLKSATFEGQISPPSRLEGLRLRYWSRKEAPRHERHLRLPSFVQLFPF